MRVIGLKVQTAAAGESEAKVRQLFQEAADVAPCIVFIGRSSALTSLEPEASFYSLNA